MSDFKLITYNIWHGKYLERVIDFLREEDADVICLQEVATKGQGVGPKDINIYEIIKSELGYAGVFAPMVEFDEGGGLYNFGLAILTKGKTLHEETHFYFRDFQRFEEWERNRYRWPRAVLRADVGLQGERMTVFTTHFLVTPEASVTDYQLKAAYRLREYLDQYDNFILCGDMNTPFGTETYELLSEGLVDGSPVDKPTLHPTIHRVGHLGYHVDYVFLKGEQFEVKESWVPEVDGSDHLPVVVELVTRD